jgi:hypothetical protein
MILIERKAVGLVMMMRKTQNEREEKKRPHKSKTKEAAAFYADL